MGIQVIAHCITSQPVLPDHAIAVNRSELSINSLQGFVVVLVIRSCAGKLASGLLYGIYVGYIKDFPANRFICGYSGST